MACVPSALRARTARRMNSQRGRIKYVAGTALHRVNARGAGRARAPAPESRAVGSSRSGPRAGAAAPRWPVPEGEETATRDSAVSGVCGGTQLGCRTK